MIKKYFIKKETNPNNYIRDWKVEYRKNKWSKEYYEIKYYKQINFKKLLKEIKKIMNNDIYTDFIIKELDDFYGSI